MSSVPNIRQQTQENKSLTYINYKKKTRKSKLYLKEIKKETDVWSKISKNFRLYRYQYNRMLFIWSIMQVMTFTVDFRSYVQETGFIW